jgi:cell shape-determining protein MreC
LADLFWKRFLKEYIPLLISRQKWLVPKRDLKVGDLVLLSDEGYARGYCPIGRVVQTFQDSDGHVRKVSVKTKNGTKLRPISKLCIFECAK